jgi:Erythromycin biosynthesis protein CIII-like, C-terminal domain
VWRYRADITASARRDRRSGANPLRALVYVSFGSVAGSLGRFDALYPAILEVLADLPVRVLITTGDGYGSVRLDPLPANAWAQWWPQPAAMREAALLIGHGGFGTTMTAVAAGVPQLVLPLFSSDQFQNAERVEAVGETENMATSTVKGQRGCGDASPPQAGCHIGAARPHSHATEFRTRPAPCRLPALYAIARSWPGQSRMTCYHQMITEGAVASRRSRCRS